jgi:hypothetical protein
MRSGAANRARGHAHARKALGVLIACAPSSMAHMADDICHTSFESAYHFLEVGFA